MSRSLCDHRRLDLDHADAQQLTACAAALREETSQARHTNRHQDPYPLYSLAELIDVVSREVSTGRLEPKHPIRRSVLALAKNLHRTIDPSAPR